MSIRTYINSSDLNSTVFSDFNLSGYIDQANNQLDYVSYSNNIDPSGEINTTVNFLLKQYGVAYTYRQCALDKIGANNNDLSENDKYFMLYNIYNDECERCIKYITPEIFTDEADTGNEMASTCVIYRG
jgi:hypothetical protein